MTRFFKLIVAAAALFVTLVAVSVYALFHGYFDHGHFVIKEFQQSATNQVAIVAERSDHEALGGLVDYVFIANHIPNARELRRAYYSDKVVFSAASDCITLRWENPNKLIIRCEDSTIDDSHINVQKVRINEVSIAYENINPK